MAGLEAVVVDPLAAAAAAGLRYVASDQPGVRRQRHGRGFRYFGPDGAPLREAATLARIKALAIPPAWTEVWICPHPDGHLQATGRDARGRKQYRYHPAWRATRDAGKFDKLAAFAAALPAIRAQVDADLRRPGLPRERVLAMVVQLLERTRLRVGNEEYRKQNRSFGLTTLRNRHVDIDGGTLTFSFRGKSGVRQEVELHDRRLARLVRRCQELPGQELFQYLDNDGRRCAVTSGDVNDYLREVTAQPFTAKDFRTWGGTVAAAMCLLGLAPCDSETARRHNLVAAVRQVAGELGNTAAVCRKYYIHPAVADSYLAGTLQQRLGRLPPEPDDPFALRPEEVVTLRLLTAG